MGREWWSSILRLLRFQKETKISSLSLELGRVFHHNLTLWLTVLLLSAYFPALVFWHAGFMQLKTRGGMMEFRWSRAKRRYFSARSSEEELLWFHFCWTAMVRSSNELLRVAPTNYLSGQTDTAAEDTVCRSNRITKVNSSMPSSPQKEISH